jgi:hypothetical protein
VSNSTIVQVDWYDLIKLTDEQVKQGNISDISMSDWQLVMEDFQHKGLVQ